MQLSAEEIGLWQCQDLQREFLYIRVVVVWLREDRRKFRQKNSRQKNSRSCAQDQVVLVLMLEHESSHKDMMQAIAKWQNKTKEMEEGSIRRGAKQSNSRCCCSLGEALPGHSCDVALFIPPVCKVQTQLPKPSVTFLGLLLDWSTAPQLC